MVLDIAKRIKIRNSGSARVSNYDSRDSSRSSETSSVVTVPGFGNNVHFSKFTMEGFGFLTDGYMDWQRKQADPINDNYPLMQNPSGMILILVIYFLTVIYGPKLMANRKPFDLKRYTMIYNCVQLFYCGFYTIRVYQLTERHPDGLYLMCKKWNRERNAITEEIAFYQYVNFVCRVCELSETVVHILRKKTRQLSYLHVCHHSLNVFLSWMTSRFQPGKFFLFRLNFFILFRRDCVHGLLNQFRGALRHVRLLLNGIPA